MNLNKIGCIRDKNILFLQGPMGLFFAKLEKLFYKAGANTFRIGLNAGDYFFSSHHSFTPFRGRPEEWMEFISAFLEEQQIDKLFLFGDCRSYQSIAIEAAQQLNVEVFVFEEGYIRPDYITLERSGVNDYSSIPKDPAFYREIVLKSLPSPEPVKTSRFAQANSAALYYALANLFSWRYPHYKHHRDFSFFTELYFGARSLVRKFFYARNERGVSEKISGEWSKQYFFVPLQTHNDFQILQHSGYGSIEKFIIEVLESFSENASKEHMLIFKHHPVDRGRKDYAPFIFEQARGLGIQDRIKVYHDVHLPTLLKNALGTVTINSTVGLSSLYHNTPTVTMGNAIYSIEGLSAQADELNDFWANQKPVDTELFKSFQQYLIENTQLNGSFYGRLFLNEEHYR